MIIQKGKIINIQVYKHNGKLYRQFNGVKIIEILPYTLVIFMYKTKVAESLKQKWIVREPTLWFFPIKKQQFYNTTALIRKNGIYFYTNIASPPIFEDNILKFIDYDLDIKAYPKERIKVVDQVEYKKNKVVYKYPDKLKITIAFTIKETLKLIKNKKNFFNKKIIQKYIEKLINEKLINEKFIK